MRFTRRQLLTAALAISVWPVATRMSRYPCGSGVLDLRYSTAGGQRARSEAVTWVLGCSVTIGSGEHRGDEYFSQLVRAIGLDTSIAMIGAGPLEQLESLHARGTGSPERAGIALQRLLDASGGRMSWEMVQGAASGIYSLNLRA